MERRAFLGTMAAGTAILGTTSRAAEPGKKLRVGLIGCGWYGSVVLKAAFKAGGIEVVALCDVDTAHLEKMGQQLSEWQPGTPTRYADWRKLLDHVGLEAVVIATPPHWHALPFIEACRRGLHIYCEKPLAYDIREGQAMVEAAGSSPSVVQIGFQRRQSAAIRQAASYIGEGRPGRIVTAAAQIHYPAELRDPTPKAPPASLDWDAWCGPAPKLPYSEQVGHFAWRLEKAYGNGHLVDWGIHWIDAIRMALGLGMPRAVTASGGLYELKGRITTPDVLQVYFDFEQCPVTWNHRIFPTAELTPEANIGMSFFGEKESVFLNDNRFVVAPVEKDAERRVVEAKGDAQSAHVAEWLEAVRTGSAVSSPPADAFQSTAAVQLAMVALEAGGRVEWDDTTKQVTGNPEGAALLKRDYRGPWVHPRQG